MLQGLIFDFDHTIIENIDSTDYDILAILKQFKKDLEKDRTLKYIQEATSDYFICKNFLSIEDAESAYSLILQLNIQKMKNVTYSAELTHILEVLSRRYRLFILSGRDQKSLNYSLAMAGIDHLFHDIVGDNSSSEPKPNPMTLIKLAQRNNLNLKNCLYIGDSQTDYALAKFAGCNFLGAAWFHNNLTQVTPICYDIKNLITAIESQFQNTIS